MLLRFASPGRDASTGGLVDTPGSLTMTRPTCRGTQQGELRSGKLQIVEKALQAWVCGGGWKTARYGERCTCLGLRGGGSLEVCSDRL